jgi:hypothetical protein
MGREPTACDRGCGAIVEQPATGRRRLYCSQTCRELAYRARKLDKAVKDALAAAGVEPVSSTVETAPVPLASVDETRPRVRPRRQGKARLTYRDLFSDPDRP